MSHRFICSWLNSLSHEEGGQRVDLVGREDLVLPREELTLCKGTDNPSYIVGLSQESVQEPSTRSIFRPVLVGEVTSTTSRRDQYCLLWVTSTGPIADQYWSHLPPLLLYPREQPILVGGLTYIGSPPPHGGRANSLIRHSGVPSARDTKRPHEEGSTDSASPPTKMS